MPCIKRYLASTKGVAVEDIFADIGKLEATAKEKTGWATQKPLALLHRLIKAASNPGDLVLDPFAGCATCCVAAALEDRQWVAIEACEAAADIVQVRLAEAKDGELARANESTQYNAGICRRPRSAPTSRARNRNAALVPTAPARPSTTFTECSAAIAPAAATTTVPRISP